MRHHVALSVVGTDRLARTEGGYFAAKSAQEKLIRHSGRDYSIVHATQFFEFIKSIADAATSQNIVRLSNALIQPMAADDVAAATASVAAGKPVNGVVEFAGPEQFRLEELVQRELRIRDDPREVVADPLAMYFGTELDERELLPSVGATIAPTRFGSGSRLADAIRRRRAAPKLTPSDVRQIGQVAPGRRAGRWHDGHRARFRPPQVPSVATRARTGGRRDDAVRALPHRGRHRRDQVRLLQ